MSAISNEMWYALSSVTKESDGGKTVSLNSGSIADKEELNVQVETMLNDYKKRNIVFIPVTKQEGYRRKNARTSPLHHRYSSLLEANVFRPNEQLPFETV